MLDQSKKSLSFGIEWINLICYFNFFRKENHRWEHWGLSVQDIKEFSSNRNLQLH